MMTLRFDLNAVKGSRLVTFLSLGELAMADPRDLRPGAGLRLVDEDDDSYLATVEDLTGDRLELSVDMDSLRPAMTFDQVVQSDVMTLMEALRKSIIESGTPPQERPTSVPEPQIKIPTIIPSAA